ncbi:MAG: inositol-3-phosphate synthase [Dehalococcoidia bacterium]|nr:inositol-3-phosphate synthase [Dehalococcoidia bacterium]MCH2528398.1 inositol-3-phosphate synthase [Dehalococcoidia bacterium]MQG60035.1 inositol-3-phosphate synthase [SAR202 cluster bacterium]
MGRIKVAIIGVGNCASSLVQGIHQYPETPDNVRVPGIMHNKIGDYKIEDIEVVAAFDVDKNKVGKDLSEAIFCEPNNTIKFAEVPKSGVVVQMGSVQDGIGQYTEHLVEPSSQKTSDISKILKEKEVDVVINYLPVGSQAATEWYTEQILDAKCAMVNCIPVFIAKNKYWSNKFKETGVPIVGDDIKSQVGATILHRVLTRLFEDRGVTVDNTYQLNFGGNTDFLNMLERERLVSKKISKTSAVTSQMDNDVDPNTVHIGPSDHVPWLNDRKWAYIRMEGKLFGEAPVNVEVKLEVWDSPNSAGVVVDAIRCAKLGLDRGIGGPIESASAYFMKSPPKQFTDDQARTLLDKFIEIS